VQARRLDVAELLRESSDLNVAKLFEAPQVSKLEAHCARAGVGRRGAKSHL
jgi:hypothetical protein